jgi:hypothetical protein
LVTYLEENNILPSRQSGFRSGHSTATLLLDIIDDVLNAQDSGAGTVLVLLDYSRAFDCINTELLISKLFYYGFDDVALQWFTSYLSGRNQRVQTVNETTGTESISKTVTVERGVPQGSILGPVLFILYTADIVQSITNCKFHLHADDLQVYYSFNPDETSKAVDMLNQDLERINCWSEQNNLVINPQKSKFLILGTKNQILRIRNQTLSLKIGDCSVELVDEARNLGVLMDGNLKFENHVKEIIKNCYYRLKVLYRIREYLNVDLRIFLCESLILSKLNYASTVIGGCLLSRTKKLLQRVQNACARYCFPIPRRTHITPFLNRGGLLNIDSRFKLHFASLLFGVIKNKNPPYLFQKLTFSQRPVRSASKLAYARHTTAAFEGSFRHAATKCWNDVPPPIRISVSRMVFKNKFKIYLLECQKRVCS